jgi:hypothetical protein
LARLTSRKWLKSRADAGVCFLRPANGAGDDLGVHEKAVDAAVTRKLIHLIYGVVKSGRPFDVDLVVPRLD